MKYSTGIIWNGKLSNWMIFLLLLIQHPLKTELLSLGVLGRCACNTSLVLLFCSVRGPFAGVSWVVCYWFLCVLKPSWANCPPERVSYHGAALCSVCSSAPQASLAAELPLPSYVFSVKFKRSATYWMQYPWITNVCSCTIHSTAHTAAFYETE